jgi:hypothetical protein
MVEVFGHPEDVEVWQRAARGDMPDWTSFLSGYSAAVDWPASSFWEELAEQFPDAIVLLSVRDPQSWWESVSSTIMSPIRAALSEPPQGLEEWSAMIRDLFANRFTSSLDKDKWIAAFEAHNDHVRKTAPEDRLVEWTATEGWEPLCRALDISIPPEPFPWTNKREDWGRPAG